MTNDEKIEIDRTDFELMTFPLLAEITQLKTEREHLKEVVRRLKAQRDEQAKIIDDLIDENKQSVLFKTITNGRVYLLRVHMMQMTESYTGVIAMDTAQVIHFLVYEIRNDYRLDSKAKNKWRDAGRIMELLAENWAGFKIVIPAYGKKTRVLEYTP